MYEDVMPNPNWRSDYPYMCTLCESALVALAASPAGKAYLAIREHVEVAYSHIGWLACNGHADKAATVAAMISELIALAHCKPIIFPLMPNHRAPYGVRHGSALNK